MTGPGRPGPQDETFPVGLYMRGRLAVVVGSGGLAAGVSGRLLLAGARVRVVGPARSQVVASLAASGLVEFRDRDYEAADLDGADLVLPCSERDDVNDRAVSDASIRNILSAAPPAGQAAAAPWPVPAPPEPDAAVFSPPKPDRAVSAPPKPDRSGPGHRVLVLGGARSGKSVLAESMLADAAAVDYVATSARPGSGDAEWDERVREHQARRPPGWRTLETAELAPVLAGPASAPPVLIDCLATWLARVMDESGVWTDAPGAATTLALRLDELISGWERTSRPVVAVSNEVGSGIVPATRSGRVFRDELGRLNAKLAARSEQVWLCTAGIGQRLR